MRRLTILICALAAAGPALAGQPVSLRPDAASPERVVRLGDIFQGAGPASQTPVAVRSGASVILNARSVQLAAARAGLDWANPEGVTTIVVHGGGASSAAAPAARGEVQVLAYARSLAAGEIVKPEDLVWTSAVAQPAGAPGDAEAVIGMAAKRPLRAGAFASLRDVGAAQVIRSGETVTVSFTSDGVSLSLEGKAMNAAGVGELIGIQNTASKKIIQGVVAGPGQVVVGPAADALKAAGPARYALR